MAKIKMIDQIIETDIKVAIIDNQRIPYIEYFSCLFKIDEETLEVVEEIFAKERNLIGLYKIKHLEESK